MARPTDEKAHIARLATRLGNLEWGDWIDITYNMVKAQPMGVRGLKDQATPENWFTKQEEHE
jgi:hypothetical protein